eukprot:66724_1
MQLSCYTIKNLVELNDTNQIKKEDHMTSYTWKVTDATLLNKIKSAANKDLFSSPSFTICNLRWYLALYPNGTDKSSEGCFNLFLRLVMLPKKVLKIIFRRKLKIEETDTLSHIRKTFQEGHTNTGWPDSTLKTNEIQPFNTLTFSVDIEILGIFDQDENDITNQYLSKNDE